MNCRHCCAVANENIFAGLWRDRHHNNDGARTLIRAKLRALVSILREEQKS